MGKNALVLGIIVVSTAFCACSGAIAQESASQNPLRQAAPPSNKPRVWTNDNIETVRSPSDTYLKNKAQQAQGSSTKPSTEKAVASGADDPPPAKLNARTLQEADQMIAQQASLLAGEQQYIEQIKEEAADAPESQKLRLQGRIESHTMGIDKTKIVIADLQKQREELADKSGAGNGVISTQH